MLYMIQSEKMGLIAILMYNLCLMILDADPGTKKL